MNTLIVPTVPKNSQTSVRIWHIGQSTIFWTGDSFSSLPSIVHLCPMTMADSTQMCDLIPENVPPACSILWITLFTFSKCSHTNLLIPGFPGIVLLWKSFLYTVAFFLGCHSALASKHWDIAFGVLALLGLRACFLSALSVQRRAAKR